MKITEIKVNPNNPRFIKDEKFELLKKSISDFPKMMDLRPIVIDNDNIILGGNMRYQVLKALGYKDIPDNWVKKTDELTEDEKQRFIISDNASFGNWDFDLLANNWDEKDLTEWGLDLPVFDRFEGNIDDFFTENTENETKKAKLCPHCGKVIN